jgi:hypothetical protein
MEDSKSVPVGSPVRQNEPLVRIGSHTQQSEPVGNKKRIISMALKRARCAGLQDRGEVVRVRWAANRGTWERNVCVCVWAVGMWWGIEERSRDIRVEA